MSYSLDINADLGNGPICQYDTDVTYNYGYMLGALIDHDDKDKKPGLWQLDGLKCREARPVLRNALYRMINKADEIRALQQSKSWGNFEQLRELLTEILAKCDAMPDAFISVGP